MKAKRSQQSPRAPARSMLLCLLVGALLLAIGGLFHLLGRKPDGGGARAPTVDLGTGRPPTHAGNHSFAKHPTARTASSDRDGGVDTARHHHATAPAAVPRWVDQESDPVRRRRLMRMHALASARVRLAMLRRRRRLLTKTLAASPSGSSRARDLDKQLAQLDRAIDRSRRDVSKLTP